jgi:hypothetical protein
MGAAGPLHLQHTWRDQALLLKAPCSFPLVYINLELPKRIVNNAIGGKNIPTFRLSRSGRT